MVCNSKAGLLISLPMVTIITVVRNGENSIDKTIASVKEQDYPNIE